MNICKILKIHLTISLSIYIDIESVSQLREIEEYETYVFNTHCREREREREERDFGNLEHISLNIYTNVYFIIHITYLLSQSVSRSVILKEGDITFRFFSSIGHYFFSIHKEI